MNKKIIALFLAVQFLGVYSANVVANHHGSSHSHTSDSAQRYSHAVDHYPHDSIEDLSLRLKKLRKENEDNCAQISSWLDRQEEAMKAEIKAVKEEQYTAKMVDAAMEPIWNEMDADYEAYGWDYLVIKFKNVYMNKDNWPEISTKMHHRLPLIIDRKIKAIREHYRKIEYNRITKPILDLVRAIEVKGVAKMRAENK